MGAVDTLHISSLETVGRAIGWSLRFIVLVALYFIVFAAAGSLVAPYKQRSLPQRQPGTPDDRIGASHPY